MEYELEEAINMKVIKKFISVMTGAALVLSVFTGCAPETKAPAANETPAAAESPAASQAPSSSFDATKDIVVISREEGSGTRGAFIELMGVEVKQDDGTKVDMTTVEAQITNDTAVMLTTVAGNPYGIGYISLGSLNDTVKAIMVDGVAPTVENIKAGTYKVSRPFNIATKGDVSEAAQDFMNFIMSAEGQEVVAKSKYIKINDAAAAFAPAGVSGKVVVAGSSSVTPVMEKLVEAYHAINPNVTIEIQQSDSSTGIKSVTDGTCDIGMASRELKDTELEKGLNPTAIAMDGIAVIVNNENTFSDLTSEQIRAIFTGEILSWSELA